MLRLPQLVPGTTLKFRIIFLQLVTGSLRQRANLVLSISSAGGVCWLSIRLGVDSMGTGAATLVAGGICGVAGVIASTVVGFLSATGGGLM